MISTDFSALVASNRRAFAVGGKVPGKLLGCAGNGCVFQAGKGKVIKVSMHDREARLAAWLAGPRKEPFLPRFYAARVIPGPEVGLPPVFRIGVLLREDLRDFPMPTKGLYDEAVNEMLSEELDPEDVISTYKGHLSKKEAQALNAIGSLLRWGEGKGIFFDPMEFSWEDDPDFDPEYDDEPLLPNAVDNLGLTSKGRVVVRDLGGFEVDRTRAPLKNPRGRGDERLRRAERAMAAGDVSAAEEYLWITAQRGRWFLPRDWEGPDGQGSPWAGTVNTNRSYWVRLLGYLRWPGAADFQEVVATQAPPRAVIDYPAQEGPHAHAAFTWTESPQPMHELGRVRPFAKIGPKTAEGIGVDVMAAISDAAVEFALSVVDLGPWLTFQYLQDARRLTRQRQDLQRGWRSHEAKLVSYEGLYSGPEWEAFNTGRKQLEANLAEIVRAVRSHQDRGFYGSAKQASHEAREAFYYHFSAFGRHPTGRARSRGQAFAKAVHAVGWACEAERGGEGEQRGGNEWWRRRSPSRGCMTKANRAIKQAVLPAALLAIAGQIMRYQ